MVLFQDNRILVPSDVMKAMAHRKRVHAFEENVKHEQKKLILAYLCHCQMNWNNIFVTQYRQTLFLRDKETIKQSMCLCSFGRPSEF